MFYGWMENPSLAQTLKFDPTEFPNSEFGISGPMLRMHVKGARPPNIRYFKQEFLGDGISGKVWKAIDVDSAKFVAVKILAVSMGSSQEMLRSMVKSEVEIISSIKHVSMGAFKSFYA